MVVLGTILSVSSGSIHAIVAQSNPETVALEGFDRYALDSMQSLHAPGVAVGVILRGKIVLAKGYGVKDICCDSPVGANTLFDIASMTKSFTTTAMAVLVDQGKLDWNKPVRDYLPWFEMYDPIATHLVTPRDLVAHRCGLPTHDFLRFSTYLSREELVRRVRYLQPNHSFRDVYEYNNILYATAGFLAGEVAGTSWEELVKQDVFAPLGMTGSNTSAVEIQKASDFARPHALRAGVVSGIPFYEYQPFGVGPNGAVNSSVNDMLKYLAFHLGDGTANGRAIVSPAQMRQLHAPVSATPSGGYALGWNTDYYRGHFLLWHSGSINGFTSRMAIAPNEQIGIVVLTNLDRSPLPQVLADTLLDRLLGLEAKDHLQQAIRNLAELQASTDTGNADLESHRVPGAKPTLELSAYAGSYFHPAYGTINVETKGDLLLVKFDAVSIPMKHYNYDTFEMDMDAVLGMDGADGKHRLAQFRIDAFGKVNELFLPLEPTVEPFVFVRQSK